MMSAQPMTQPAMTQSETIQPATTQPAPFVTRPEDAPAYWQDGALWTVLASGEQTQGVFTMLEQLMPGGGGPPPHTHERFHEVFYLLEGEITFQVGETLLTVGKGATVWIPPGTVHSFYIESETARALNMYTPGGFDNTISMLATPAGARTLPPEGAVKEATPGQERAFLERIRELYVQTWTNTPSLLPGADPRED